MNLKSWLNKHQFTQAHFARLIGAEPSDVNRWVKGERKPALGWVQKIRDTTDGAVDLDAWLDSEPEGDNAP